MNVNIQGAPIYFEIPILGGIPITATLVVSWGVMLVLTLVCIWLTHDLKVRNISKRQAIAEKIVITAQNFVRNNMGEAWMRYVPFVSTIFAMSIFSSLSSLVGLWPPTADVSTTLAWGIVVFVIITYTKLRTNGLLGYLKGFCDPIFVMAPFNVLGEVFTPISMAFRHFGNIVSGTVISTLVYAALVVLHHPRRHRGVSGRDPVPHRRHPRRHLFVLRLVRKLHAGVHLLHADDDVHFHRGRVILAYLIYYAASCRR